MPDARGPRFLMYSAISSREPGFGFFWKRVCFVLFGLFALGGGLEEGVGGGV